MRKALHRTGLCLLALPAVLLLCNGLIPAQEVDILTYVVNPMESRLRMYSRDEQGKPYANFERVKAQLESQNQRLIFAMNGGMYRKNLRPQGLYVEAGRLEVPLDSASYGYGNFYLLPNGVFSLSQAGEAEICPTDEFELHPDIAYATQSGPMLVIDSILHPAFTKGSSNLHIRNGVGILPDGSVLFAMSKSPVNFYDFATFFKRNGCRYALYLDGFVSRTYLPEADWVQLEGSFGVIIAVSEAIE